MTYPKLVALDTDWTIFRGSLDINQFGKRPGAAPIAEDNLEFDPARKDWVLRDRTNHALQIEMYPDVPRIVTDIMKNGAKLAIVSRNKSKGLCDRALWYFKATDPNDNNKLKSIIYMVKFDEVYDQDKKVHFGRIKGWTGFDYSDMILFDDEATNNLVRVELGVTFQLLRYQKGLTWANYQEGLNVWRRAQAIRTPYIGQNITSYREPMLIGYSGMDEQTVNLLTQGKHRVDLKESARWGYAMYVADDVKLANFFANWIKQDAFGSNAKTYVCEIWVRDKQKFLATNKVWLPEKGAWMSNVKTEAASKIAMDQENRDARAAQWGAPPPYIMFSRHFWMNNMPIPRTRWNEMVVFAQIQDAMMLTIPLSDQRLAQLINLNHRALPFEQQITKWNIKVPQETWADFAAHGENIRP